MGKIKYFIKQCRQKKAKNASHAKIVNTANTVYNFKKYTEQNLTSKKNLGKMQKVQTKGEKNSKSQEIFGNIVNNIKMQRHAKTCKMIKI